MFNGSSFPFAELAQPAPQQASLPAPCPPAFNPDSVPRITFRWTRAIREDQLGPGFSPEGRYVFAGDYARLLQMYHELESLLEELRKRK